MPLYDYEGVEVAGALDPESAKALQEKAAEAEALKAKTTEFETTLKEKEAELEKLSKKDFNFQRLREKSEEEITEMQKKMSEKDRAAFQEQLELSKEVGAMRKEKENEQKTGLLNRLGGNNEELKAKIEAEVMNARKMYGVKSDVAVSLEDEYRRASIIVQGEIPRANPIFSGYRPSYTPPDLSEKPFTETEKGKESLKAWFPAVASKIYKEKK